MGRLVAFGEVLLRMSPPGRELLMQTPRLDVWVGGAEANVAVALARLGHEGALVSAVPADPLGEAAVTSLRGNGVDVSGIARGPGRMGIYYATGGAGHRAPEILYDRAQSAFAGMPPDAWDWERQLRGADRLHLSGITPALGAGPAQAALAAADAARRSGVPISFDGNFRAKLWKVRGGDPRPVLSQFAARADLLFVDHRDLSLLLGRDLPGRDEGERRAAAEAAFAALPSVRLVASTLRRIEDADRHRLSARIDTREGCWQTDEIVLSNIVDRIGTGDAFAAGVLHALFSGRSMEDAGRTGLALSALKHSLPGDMSLFGTRDLDAFAAGGLAVRR